MSGDNSKDKYSNAKQAIKQFLDEESKLLHFSKSKLGAIRSKAFYTAFKRMADEFVQKVKDIDFPIIDDKFWGYKVEYNEREIRLVLVKYKENIYKDINEVEHISLNKAESFCIYKVEAKLLSIEEYAQYYGVDPKTVTQWIRRGKIRTAKKICNVWMIPETTDIPSRGYTDAMYLIVSDIRPLSDEYPFLIGKKYISIQQDEVNKNTYIVSCMKGYDGTLESLKPVYVHEMTLKEKEKFELGLVTHPGVVYVPYYYDSMKIDIDKANSLFY